MISVIVPAFNEEDNILPLVEQLDSALDSFLPDYEMIIVDDYSSDETWNMLNQASQMYSKLRIARNEKNLGILKSWQVGLELSRFPSACLIDADLQTSPFDIEILWNSIEEKSYEVAQGVRVHAKNISISRTLASRVLNNLLNIVFLQKARDSKSGFVIAPTKSLLEFCYEFENYKFGQTFIGIWLRKKHGRVKEIETEFRERSAGKSFILSRKIAFVILRVLFEIFQSKRVFRRLSNSFEIDRVFSHGRYPARPKNLRKSIYFLTLPLHTWNISKRLNKYYDTVGMLKFESLDTLKSIQSDRLQKLLAHSKLTTKHYQRIIPSGFCDRISSSSYLDLLASLPLLEKDFLRNNQSVLLSNSFNVNDLYKITTSGSTGTPLSILVDDFQLTMRFATTLRAIESAGWEWGDSHIRLWHQTLGMSKLQIIKEKFDALILRRKFVPAFSMTSGGIESFLSQVEKRKPTLVDGYAESLNVIAVSANLPLKHNPIAIISSAQELTDSTRMNVEYVFGCPVLNKYGAREFSGMAYECAEGRRLHVAMESYIIEVLDEGKPVRPGEIGEVFVTDLNNWSMPIIRYAIGDLAELGPLGICKCGRDTQTLKRIIGRTQALVYGTNGVILPGTYFSHLFKDFAGAIQSYQIFQASNLDVEVRFIPAREFRREALEEIELAIRGTLGKEMAISFTEVESINLGRTGKRQSVVSELSPNPGQLSMRNLRLK
jgi:phenylacetate-CoA ligase